MVFDKIKIGSLLGGRAEAEVFESLPSTNTYAVQTLQKSKMPRLIIACEQTAGKGRMGRSFYSPAGTGLYMSAVLFPSCPPECLQRITPAAAVSVCRAIESRSTLLPQIKWVNDILIGGKKVCGILAETVCIGKDIAVIVGIGVNISTNAFPGELDKTACSLDLSHMDINAFAAEIFLNLMAESEKLESGEVIDDYRRRLVTINKEITFMRGDERLAAFAVDVNSMGNLLVRRGDEIITLASGEVTMHQENPKA